MSRIVVLLVDDDALVRQILARLVLQRYPDAAVVHAVDGQEAYDLFHQQPVDLIITDYEMPRMDGIQLTTVLRQQQQHVPIVLLSGAAFIEARAWAAGVSGFIYKPFTAAELYATLATLIP